MYQIVHNYSHKIKCCKPRKLLLEISGSPYRKVKLHVSTVNFENLNYQLITVLDKIQHVFPEDLTVIQ